jgi:hypothetical protein
LIKTLPTRRNSPISAYPGSMKNITQELTIQGGREPPNYMIALESNKLHMHHSFGEGLAICVEVRVFLGDFMTVLCFFLSPCLIHSPMTLRSLILPFPCVLSFFALFPFAAHGWFFRLSG